MRVIRATISGVALCRFYAGYLSVLSLYQETDDTTTHTEDFKREAVRIGLSSGLSRTHIATDLGIANPPWLNG